MNGLLEVGKNRRFLINDKSEPIHKDFFLIAISSNKNEK